MLRGGVNTMALAGKNSLCDPLVAVACCADSTQEPLSAKGRNGPPLPGQCFIEYESLITSRATRQSQQSAIVFSLS